MMSLVVSESVVCDYSTIANYLQNRGPYVGYFGPLGPRRIPWSPSMGH